MITPRFKATIRNSKPVLQNNDAFILWCGSLENKEVEITVKEYEKNRTTSQNSFYWNYLNLIQKECGDDAEYLHEIAKRLFLPPKFITILGKEYKLPASTKNLTTVEFSEYLEKICRWSGVPIPIIEY